MSAVSLHKSGGSLTQSSMLLCGGSVNADYVRQIINITQTTSASYLLLSSLDISRRNLALHGTQRSLAEGDTAGPVCAGGNQRSGRLLRVFRRN